MVSLTVVRLWGSTSKLIIVLQHLSFLPTILSDLWVGLSSDRRPVLGIINYRNCYQLFLHWRLKFVIKWSYIIFVSYEKFNIHTTTHWSPRRIRPLDFPNEFINFSLWLGKKIQCYQENIWDDKFLKVHVWSIHYGLHIPITHSLFKR